MAIKGRRHKGSFVTRGSDGREYLVHEYVQLIDVGSADDPDETLDGLHELLLEDGREVIRVEKGRYEIVGESVTLTATSLAAP